MKIEVISIGGELLSGFSTNTNAVFIGRKLRQEGFTVCRQEVVPDEFDIIQEVFQAALKRSHIVIVTGGLGPTLDDITKDVVADLFKSGFRFDEEIANDLKMRFGDGLLSLENQSTVPANAIVLKNKIGTAPGFIFHHENSLLILVPGVPREMESMIVEDVIPYLKQHYSHLEKSYVRSLYFFGLNEISIDPSLRQLKKEFPLIEFGIYPGAGKVSVIMKSTVLSEVDANYQFNLCSAMLLKEFESHVFKSSFEKIEEAIHDQFTKKNLTLSLAESCTGGFVSAKLVSVKGASNYFLGSFVCYTNFFKEKFLSASKKVLDEDGAVSVNCVTEMAINLLELTGSDYSLAISGIAGPSGETATKPVGTIFGAIGYKTLKGNEVKVIQFNAKGNRGQIIEWAANRMLFELHLLLL